MPISKLHLYHQEYNNMATFFRVIGHGARLSILKYLQEHGPVNNKELVEFLKLSQSTVSEHLRLLLSIDIIIATQRETSILYDINELRWEQLEDNLREFWQRDL